MAILDAVMGKVAKTVVGTFGRPASIVRPGSGGTYNPATGNIEGASTETSTACEVVFDVFTESQIDGSLIKSGDRKAIVSRLRLGFEPNPASDELVEGGRTWKILGLIGFSSGAQEAAYQLHVRR